MNVSIFQRYIHVIIKKYAVQNNEMDGCSQLLNNLQKVISTIRQNESVVYIFFPYRLFNSGFQGLTSYRSVRQSKLSHKKVAQQIAIGERLYVPLDHNIQHHQQRSHLSPHHYVIQLLGYHLKIKINLK